MSKPMTTATEKALLQGYVDGPAMLDWMNQRQMGTGGAVAALAWVLAIILDDAADQETHDAIGEAFEGTVNCYQQFFADTKNPEIMAEIDAKMAETDAAEPRH